jgi:hypothetical protein
VALRLAVVRGYEYKKSERSLGSVRERPSVHELFIGTRENRGDVVQLRIVDGQPRILNGFEISVDELVLRHELILNYVGGCIEQQPDLMLTELQDRLQLQFIGR